MTPGARPPLSDSPWFWLYVFGTAGILALLFMGPKFGARQSQLDRQFEGRRHVMTQPADAAAAQPFSSPERREATLRPLYGILLVALVGGWIALWWQRYRVRPSASMGGDDADILVANRDRLASTESNGGQTTGSQPPS